MSLRAMLTRRQATVVVRAAVSVGIALLALGVGPTRAEAAPGYPPTMPCALTVTDRSTTETTEFTVLGTGLGSSQLVDVMLQPPATTLGRFRTDADGGFSALLALPTQRLEAARLLVARSASASCSTPTPHPRSIGPGGGSGSTAASGGAGSGGGPGSGSGGSVGQGGAAASSSPSGSARSSDRPSGSASAPGSSSPAPPTPATPPASSAPLSRPNSGLGLSIGITVAVAAGLIVLGILAVLLLTRRSQ